MYVAVNKTNGSLCPGQEVAGCNWNLIYLKAQRCTTMDLLCLLIHRGLGNGQYFSDDILKFVMLSGNYYILIQIQHSVNNMLLVLVIARLQAGDNQLSGPMMNITRPQWVKRRKVLLSPIIARFNEPWYYMQHCDELVITDSWYTS